MWPTLYQSQLIPFPRFLESVKRQLEMSEAQQLFVLPCVLVLLR